MTTGEHTYVHRLTEILTADEALARTAAHEARADVLLAEFRHPGSYHPVYDFLFEYYPVRPSHLRRWHPGAGVGLHGDVPHATLRDYRRDSHDVVAVDMDALWERRGTSYEFMRSLLVATTEHVASFDCFGLHEWAMVYQTDSPRHELPLRLGAEGTSAVVESHRIRCTHYDAFRFFTTAARSLNFRVLQREDQPRLEQAGCVHTTMDLFKWAWKLGPLVPGELFLDCLELAVDARTLDMEASPYDCRELGFGVVAIETPEGKAEYVARQRALAARAEPLRARLVAQVDAAQLVRL